MGPSRKSRVELPREKGRGGLQDRVGTVRLVVLAFQLPELLPFIGREPGPPAEVDLSLARPRPRRHCHHAALRRIQEIAAYYDG